MFISHYGIQGMHWGVRRYQNEDGTLTPLGKQRLATKVTVREYGNKGKDLVKGYKDTEKIYNTFSKRDLENYTGHENPWRKEYSEHTSSIKRFIAYEGKTPVAFLNLEDTGYYEGKQYANIAIGVNRNYRKKGYGTMVAKAADDFINKHKDEYASVSWTALNRNQGSKKLAENLGYKRQPDTIRKNPFTKNKTYIIYDYGKNTDWMDVEYNKFDYTDFIKDEKYKVKHKKLNL